MPSIVQASAPRTTENRRYASRRSLNLKSALSDSGVEIVIHDISPTGMLIETSQKLAAGETLVLDLPELGQTSATVAWSSGNFFGCQFELSIPAAAVSAALLRSSPLEPVPVSGSGDAAMLGRLAVEAVQEEEAEEAVEDDRYSLRTRGVVIVSLCVSGWALIGWTASLLFN